MEEKIQLDRFQRKAIVYARSGTSVIVSAPTGTGKTLIAEHIIRDCVDNGRQVVYTAPIKALSNQKYRQFMEKYPQKTGILTGDVSIKPDAPLVVMTTEIFRNAILSSPQRLKHCEWVIFDEIHYLDDIERGTVWEESIILLPKHIKILALSATISNLDQFVNWLKSVHPFPVQAIIEKKRPVPLHFFFQCDNGFFPGLEELKKASLLSQVDKNKNTAFKRGRYPVKSNKLKTLISRLENKNSLPCVYFSFSRRRCEELASELYTTNFLTREEKNKIEEIFHGLLEKFNIQGDPYANSVYPFIQRGIAYHHAGLLPTLKEIIERLFSTGLIKLIFTTETFALGVNMPARTCVFDVLFKFYGRYSRYLKTRDFYQMAGRAGRRGLDREGYVYLRINPNKIDLLNLEKILYGNYEPINSQLNNSYATILNLYKIMGEKLVDIYPLSFHYFQAGKHRKKQAGDLLRRKILLLKEMGYIRDNRVTGKALLASTVYSFELQIGEIFESGFLDELDEHSLIMTISALVYEPRKSERRPPLNKRIRKLKSSLDPFIRKINRMEQKFRIYPFSKKFYFHLAEITRAWTEGRDFYSLTRLCSADEGEIVRYFRMTVQVLKEISSSEVVCPVLKEKLERSVKKINRGVVDAEKQLRQVI